MRIHPIQTGQVKVPQCQTNGAANNIVRLFQIFVQKKWTDWLPIYCFLIEHADGLMLIDAGERSLVHEPGYMPESAIFRSTVQYQVDRNEEVDKRIEQLGFRASDVKRIFLTHLHTDHLDGIAHFPQAEISVSAPAWEVMKGKNAASVGYVNSHLPDWFEPKLFDYDDGPEENFPRSKKLLNDGSLIAVPLPGHAPGQSGIILKTGDKRYFFSADVTLDEATLEAGIPFVVLDSPEARASVKAAAEYIQRSGATLVSFHNSRVPELLKS